MSSEIKNQLNKLRENWLLLVIALVLVLLVSGVRLPSRIAYSTMGGAPMVEMAYDEGVRASKSFYGGGDFAPEIEERIITKTASLSTETGRGTFHGQEAVLKGIVTSSDSYLLSENVQKYGEGWRAYYQGNYQIKIDTSKYEAVLAQLKMMGEVQSFGEDMEDITGDYADLEIELEVEKERLKRFEEMYEEAVEVEDKINLNDRIFNQERTIKYLEDRLENLDKRVEYSTVYFTMTEERSAFRGLVEFKGLLEGLVNSFSSLIRFLVFLVPWMAMALILMVVYKSAKKK